MRLRAAKINISEYLRPKGESTAMNYRASLNKYFQTIYPDLAAEWKPIARKPQHTQSYYDKLDDISLKYIEQDPEEHNFRQDLIEFKESMKDYAPNTASVKLSAVLGFFEENGFDIPLKLKRDLYGRDKDTRIEEHIPNAEEIRKILEHLTLPDKTLTLVLASSGMRIGETLKIIL